VILIPDPFGRTQRNLEEELMEGATDGALKKPRPNWSHRIADETDPARELLSHVEGGYDWSETAVENRRYTRGYVRGS
jgi:hypothetical protein